LFAYVLNHHFKTICSPSVDTHIYVDTLLRCLWTPFLSESCWHQLSLPCSPAVDFAHLSQSNRLI